MVGESQWQPPSVGSWSEHCHQYKHFFGHESLSVIDQYRVNILLISSIAIIISIYIYIHIYMDLFSVKYSIV